MADVLRDLVQNGSIPESVLDASVARILQLKLDAGLFQFAETGGIPPALRTRTPGSPADLALALNASRASMTLLQNRPAKG